MPYFLEFGYYNTALLSSFQDFLAVILDIVQILAALTRSWRAGVFIHLLLQSRFIHFIIHLSLFVFWFDTMLLFLYTQN